MGYPVLLNYKSDKVAADSVLKEIKEKGGDGEIIQFDVSKVEDVKSILGGWIEQHPDHQIEILVNNAGIKKDVLMMWMTDEDWHSVLDTSLTGFFNVTRQVLNGMLVNKFGRIINIVSLSGLKGLPGQTNYSAAKAGVIGATKALAQEVGRRGVTVNAIAPGFIKTEMTAALSEKELKAMIPVNRFGEPEEVAYAVGFLASKEASYITGEVLSINGGIYS